MKRKRAEIILFYGVLFLIAVIYVMVCVFCGDQKMDIKDIGILGMYLFFVISSLFSVWKKIQNQKELAAVQKAIGYAYNGELECARMQIESLKIQGKFSDFIKSNAVINLYIIYLYEENLEQAKAFYKENECVFQDAIDRKKGFTAPLWKAYELVLQENYEEARKMLSTLPKSMETSNGVYKMLMSRILCKTKSSEKAVSYMEQCLKTNTFPYMKEQIKNQLQKIRK